MNTNAQHLPSTPSELIRVALADLRAIERDEGYVVNMRRWHRPVYDNDRGVCAVCLAGAVLAKTLGVEPHEVIYDTDLARYGCDVQGLLLALDYFRRGMIEEGLSCLGYDVDELSEEWQQYARKSGYNPADPEAFHVRMNNLADYLASCGL